MTTANAPDRRFRPEIEGLRAVAAVLVMVYHVFVGRVSGGVDVFFVVAGFLITTSLVGQVTRYGRVDAARYFGRLARRLLPAALTVLTVVLVATALWLPASRRPATYSEIAASALYHENWALAAKATDYLAREEAQSPVQHFWAMSIQGQFYVLWFLLALAALGGAALLRRHVRPVLTVLLAVVAVGSFAWGVHLTAADQPFAYFHTGARAWEFAAGGLLALVIARIRLPGAVGAVGGWAGLVAIVTCGALLPVSDAFPGWVALWPVVGALLVLSCADPDHPWGVGRLLGSRPFTYVGGISYGLYLWHWPVLAFYLALVGGGTAPLLPGLVIVAVSFALAVLTTRYVEKPVRRLAERVRVSRTYAHGRRAGRTTPVLVASALALAAVAVVASSPPAVLRSTPAADPGAGGGAGAVPEIDLADVRTDRAQVYADGCHQGLDVAEVILCEYGDVAGTVTLLLAGGSHSAHWLPPVDALGRAHGWRVLTATKSSCRLGAGDPDGSAQSRSCHEWNALLLDEIDDLRPDLLLTTSTVDRGSPEEGWTEEVPDIYLAHWAELEARGVPVLALRDNPRADENLPDCLEREGIGSAACDIDRASIRDRVSPTELLDDPPTNVTFVDLTDTFCDDVVCPAVQGGTVLLYDSHHITATYARSLAPVLEPHLLSALATAQDG